MDRAENRHDIPGLQQEIILSVTRFVFHTGEKLKQTANLVTLSIYII